MSFPVESEGRGEAFIYLLVWPMEWALLRVGGMLTTPSRGAWGRHEAQLRDPNNVPYPKNRQ